MTGDTSAGGGAGRIAGVVTLVAGAIGTTAGADARSGTPFTTGGDGAPCNRREHNYHLP